MKHSHYISNLFLYLIACCHLQAQKNEFKSNTIPPSPEAASLGRYVEVPVSYYTGVAAIDVPLAEIKQGQLQLPVSLSYQSAWQSSSLLG